MKNSKYRVKNYRISNDATLLDAQNNITLDVRKIIEEIHPDAIKGRKYLLKKLPRLIEKYPQVPTFKNLLATVHQKNGDLEQAFNANRWLAKEHPNYFFGKINLAIELLEKQEIDQIPEILGKELELQSLYPERNEFHIEEFMAMNQIAVLYFLAKDDLEQAELRVEMMEEIEPDHPKVLHVNDRLMAYFFKKAAAQKNKEVERIEVIPANRRSDLQTTVPPKFNFPLQMQWVYEEGASFPKEKLEKIIQLDREALIEDLEKVLNDSIVRFDYFVEKFEEDFDALDIPLNAMLLLTELKAEESLGAILELLKQEDDFIEFWFGDFIAEVMKAVVYGLGEHRLELLVDFIKLPDIEGINKSEISTGMVSLVAKLPERRKEFLALYRDILNFFIEKADDVKFADTNAYSLIVSDVVEVGFKELLPEIKKLMESGLIDDTFYDSYEEIEETIQEQDIHMIAQDFVEGDIFQKYAYLSKMAEKYDRDFDEEMRLWEEEEEGFEMDEDEEGEDFFDEEAFQRLIMQNDNQQPLKKAKEPGRNDPCPCRSGKKYKKCCINKKE